MGIFRTVLLALSLGSASADIPVHCTRGDVVGDWTMNLGQRGHSYSDLLDFDCIHGVGEPEELNVNLSSEGNIVTNTDTNEVIGTWTLIYDQGIEITVPGKLPATNTTDVTAFFYFKYTEVNGTVTSYCGESLGPSYYHEVPSPGVAPNDWGCFEARGPLAGKGLERADHQPKGSGLKLTGARRKDRARPVQGAVVSADVPAAFSWLDVAGAVSPMRDQLSCGSCYAFAGTAVIESQARIGNAGAPHFVSPQEVVSCSPYSQGCNGGFAYLVAKYAQDFGLAGEAQFPYTSGLFNEEVGDQACEEKGLRKEGSPAYFANDLRYVGGFYGNCSEAAMREALVAHGPLAVGIEVTDAMEDYTCTGGTYVEPPAQRAARESGATEFEATNHAVVVVGYGTDDEGVDYWTVRNSWGRHFGNTGYFNIRRGTDELAIESMAFITGVVIVEAKK